MFAYKLIFRLLGIYTLSILTYVSAFNVGAQEAKESPIILNASDFGAVAGDSKNDLPAIKAALAHAKKIGACALKFEAGVYDLDTPEKSVQALVFIDRIPNFTLEGAVDAKGNPATILRRNFKYSPKVQLPSVLRAFKSENLTVKNIVLDNSPRYTATAEIMENDGEEIVLKVQQGSPYIDGTFLYCANLWDKSSRNLKNKQSVTYGGDVESSKEAYKLKAFGNPQDRLLKFKNRKVAAMCEVGELISWHFDWSNSSMSYFLMCDNLKLENISIQSGISLLVAMQVCQNVTVENVKFVSDGKSCPVGSRDGLHFAGCRGEILVDNFTCEGVRWDGINVHGITVWTEKILDKNTVMFSNESGGCFPSDFRVGEKMGLCFDRVESVFLTIAKAVHAKTLDGRRAVIVTFREEIPAQTDSSTVFNLYSLTARKVTIKNSKFKNIAGCAVIIRNDDVTVENCSFENIMYPAVCFGAALAEHEGVVCKNETVKNCVFKNCGWMPRHGARGAVVAKVQSCRKVPSGNVPYMKNISVSGAKVGFQFEGVDGLNVENNSFYDVKDTVVELGNLDVNLKNNTVN